MSRTFFIVPIVEGHGEVQAVPVLLRRLHANIIPAAGLTLNPPLRVKAGSLINDAGYFNKHVELAAQKARARANSCVLIILDCEDQCPGELGPLLLKKANLLHYNVHFIIILACHEFETWFLAAAHSLQGHCGLPAGLEPPDNCAGIRNAKGWLSSRMPHPYIETIHQPSLTQVFAFQEAMAVDSIARAVRKLRQFFRVEPI